MKTIHYKSAYRFLQSLRLSRDDWKPAFAWGFRGQADARWPLQASLLRGGRGNEAWRKFCDDHYYETAAAIFIAETEVMTLFIEEADACGLRIPTFYQESFWAECEDAKEDLVRPADPDRLKARLLRLSPESSLANVALAQHYGLPTRLLDWTAKPLVAAYFAAKEASAAQYGLKRKPSGNLAVFALNKSSLDDAPAGTINEIAVVTAPQATNPNLSAQAAFFTLDRLNRGTPLEKLLQSHLVPLLQKLTLPKSEAPRLLRMLADEGVSASSVFPGYAGVTEAVFERSLWEEQSGQMRSRWELRR